MKDTIGMSHFFHKKTVPVSHSTQYVPQIYHLDRRDKALKNTTKAPMSSAKSISIGPLVVADTPKKIRIPMSSALK